MKFNIERWVIIRNDAIWTKKGTNGKFENINEPLTRPIHFYKTDVHAKKEVERMQKWFDGDGAKAVKMLVTLEEINN